MSKHKDIIKDADAFFDIDPITREIISNTPNKARLIQFDHNSERFTFCAPKFVENHPMENCEVRIYYQCLDEKGEERYRDRYDVDDLQLHPDDEDKVIFSWLISEDVTQYAGLVQFSIRFICKDENGVVDYSWGTGIFKSISVSWSIGASEELLEKYPSILDEFKEDLVVHDSNVNRHIQEIKIGYGSESELDNLVPGLYKANHYIYEIGEPEQYYLIVTKKASQLGMGNRKQTKISNTGIETRYWNPDLTDAEGLIVGGWTEWASVSSGGGGITVDNTNNITIWRPNVTYEVGDVVLILNPLLGATIIATCILNHTSSKSLADLIEEDGGIDRYWNYEEINADKAASAMYDDEDRLIRTTYATKKEIGDIETSLENIIAKYGLGGDSI